MLIVRNQCFSACFIQGHRGFGSKQLDTSEGSEYIWPCRRPMMRDFRMTHNLKSTLHIKRKQAKKGILDNRNESRYLLNQFKIQ